MFSRRPHATPLALLAAVAICALFAIACGHAPPAPDTPGAADYYRARLAESPGGSRSGQYRDALESAEFAGAKRKETILAFRTFLSEFPDGPHQREARTLLEALRWNDAIATAPDQALQALQGFLADEPHGAHADEAWARIAGLQLEAALQSKSTKALGEWLTAHPSAAGRDRAAKALEEAEFSEAIAAPLPQRRALLQTFLLAHPDGAHRTEAEALEAKTAIDEAALLGDELELKAWIRSGNVEAADALSRLALEDAASRLDASDLDELAGKESAEATRAKALLAELKRLGPRSKEIVTASRVLRLPALHPSGADLPSTPRERANALREVALALDGRALPQLFTELSAQHVWVAQTALASALFLARSLPRDELQLRAARAAAALFPIAQDGPRLGALALALAAEGDAAGALAQARAAAARDPRSLVVQQLAARLEAEEGDRLLALVDARALAAAVRASIAARAPAPSAGGTTDAATPPPAGETDEAPMLWALCAAEEAASVANEIVAMQNKSPPGIDEAHARLAATEEARAALASAERVVAAAERAAHKDGACLLERNSLAEAARRNGEARAQAAVALSGAGDVAAEALARARRRDPSPAVRKALAAEAWDAAPSALPAATIAP